MGGSVFFTTALQQDFGRNHIKQVKNVLLLDNVAEIAVEMGVWVILSNATFCNATLLRRMDVLGVSDISVSIHFNEA